MKQARLLDRGLWKPAFISSRHFSSKFMLQPVTLFYDFLCCCYDATSSLFYEYQLHLSLVSYLLIEWLLISFQMWKAERHQNNLPYLHFFFESNEISFTKRPLLVLVMSSSIGKHSRPFQDVYRRCLWDSKNVSSVEFLRNVFIERRVRIYITIGNI